MNCSKETRLLINTQRAAVAKAIRANGGRASIAPIAAALGLDNRAAAGVVAAMVRTGLLVSIKTGNARSKLNWNAIREYRLSGDIPEASMAEASAQDEGPNLWSIWPCAPWLSQIGARS
jgi:hypothetical protein